MKNNYRKVIERLENKFFTYTYNHCGEMTCVSPEIKSVLGYEQAEFKTYHTQCLTGNPINKFAAESKNLGILGMEQPSYLIEIYNKKGEMRALEVSEKPIYDQNGEFAYLEGIAEDVTDRADIGNVATESKSDDEKDRLIAELKLCLQTLIPICTQCKQVRFDEWYWEKAKAYIENHADFFDHQGVCSSCEAKTVELPKII